MFNFKVFIVACDQAGEQICTNLVVAVATSTGADTDRKESSHELTSASHTHGMHTCMHAMHTDTHTHTHACTHTHTQHNTHAHTNTLHNTTQTEHNTP